MRRDDCEEFLIDPVRWRAISLATLIALPLTLVLVLVFNRDALRNHTSDSLEPSVRSTATVLPPTDIKAPPDSPLATQLCPAIVGKLPITLAEQRARSVNSSSSFVAAWGEPPIVFRCGVDRPPGFVVGTELQQVNGVQWFVEERDDIAIWTTVDRSVYVEMTVPREYFGAPITQLSTHIAMTLPAQEPDPA